MASEFPNFCARPCHANANGGHFCRSLNVQPQPSVNSVLQRGAISLWHSSFEMAFWPIIARATNGKPLTPHSDQWIVSELMYHQTLLLNPHTQTHCKHECLHQWEMTCNRNVYLGFYVLFFTC